MGPQRGLPQIFNVTRDTQTYEIKEVYLIGELPQQALQGAEK